MEPRRNDLAFLLDVLARLHRAEMPCLVFGGWAEELLGMRLPRSHADVDLLLPAADFTAVERFIAKEAASEVRGKRFAHKRAFLLDGVLVELVMVEPGEHGLVTRFWGDRELWWHMPLAEPNSWPVLVSRLNLDLYRCRYRSLDPGRWRDPASRVA